MAARKHPGRRRAAAATATDPNGPPDLATDYRPRLLEETVPPASRRGDQRSQDHQRCGFVALIGAPNVGKSTLINALLGTKVAIVSRKAQTTRSLLRGIAIAGASQIVLVDTPGLFVPRRRLDRAMIASAWAGAHEADIAAFLLDANRGIDEEAASVLDKLAEIRRPKILIVNKIDLVDKPLLLELAAKVNQRASFTSTFMISALTGDGIADVREWLARHVPEGPWHYPEDQVTDAPLRRLAAEITREKLYSRLHQELPYRSTVETDQWQERADGSVRIEQSIYVERESQRKIVLGKGGQTIKAIGAQARREIAEIVEAPVHLFLFVKVHPSWEDDRERYSAMSLEFPKD
jgi:GTPase